LRGGDTGIIDQDVDLPRFRFRVRDRRFDAGVVGSSFRRSIRREASTTWAPAFASTLAKRAPSPLDAPVINAIFPSKLTSIPTAQLLYPL
jgi:hypothetical protein